MKKPENNLKKALPLYMISILQGITFTLMPSASQFLTSPQGLNLSSQMYGFLFIPMVAAAILVSFLCALFSGKIRYQSIFIVISLCNLCGLGLFAVTGFLHANIFLTCVILMAFLGAGFGGMISLLNPIVYTLFSDKASSAITALHACLGVGTAIGPLLFSLSLKIGFFWFDPALLIGLFAILVPLAALRIRGISQSGVQKYKKDSKSLSQLCFITFSAIAFIYGYIETTFGNWGIMYLFKEKNFSYLDASLALSIFWFFVTLGRVLVAVITTRISSHWIYRSLPLLILISLTFLQKAVSSNSFYISFALAGLGCSCFLPLTISLASLNYPLQASKVSGILMALYLSGYAFASEGVALLQKYLNVSVGEIYLYTIAPIILLLYLTSRATQWVDCNH